jgi:hypothetical protein
VSDSDHLGAGVVDQIGLVMDPARLWPAVMTRGALSVLFGIAALIWPGLRVLTLDLLSGRGRCCRAFVVGGRRAAGTGRRDRVGVVIAAGRGAGLMAGVLPITVGVSELVLAAGVRRTIRGEAVLEAAG